MIYQFPDNLRFRDAGMKNGARLFQLTSRFRYISSLGTVTVPEGFITDGASIPKMFHSMIGPHAEYFPAAVVHDYLYSIESSRYVWDSRWEADAIFNEAMFNLGVTWPKRKIIHHAVRLFGGPCYKKQ